MLKSLAGRHKDMLQTFFSYFLIAKRGCSNVHVHMSLRFLSKLHHLPAQFGHEKSENIWMRVRDALFLDPALDTNL